MTQKTPRTQLDMLNDLITELENSLMKEKERMILLNNNEPMAAHYLGEEIERMNRRLDFLKEQREEVITSGETQYLFEFGTDDYFKQWFQKYKNPKSEFVYLTGQILDSEKTLRTPGKKIKMMETLMRVYKDFTSEQES